MTAVRDLKLTRGDLYTHIIKFKNPDGAPTSRIGYTYAAQVRSAPGVDDAASFTIDSSLLARGQLTLSLSVAQTTALPSSAVWDLEETAPGAGGPVTLIGGTVDVSEGVTQ